MMRTSTFRLSGEFVAESCGGRLLRGTGIVAEKGVSIDSRTLDAGEAFFCIRGPKFDGHVYLGAALGRGAAGLVVEEAYAEAAVAAVAADEDRAFVVAVPDTTKALAALATAWVDVMGPSVVAVTGSVGKTTTKDLCAAALGARYAVHATGGNRNNLYGLSLTCLKLLPHHEVFVAEMGMNAPGEIATLCTIAKPTVGVVTCVAPVHVEGLGSLDGIAAAKAELVEALPPEGVAVLNADDRRVAAMRGRTRARVVSFGMAPVVDVRIADVQVDSHGRPTVKLAAGGRTRTVNLALVGAHHGHNAAAALAAAMAMDVDLDAACRAMETVVPAEHRMKLLSAGTLRILDDCYNASPKSVTAALETLQALAGAGRRGAVLGDLLELGSMADEAHREVGREAVAAGVECLVAVGKFADLIREGALAAGLSSSAVFTAPDALAAATVVLALVQPRDTWVVKGSHGVGLSHVVEALMVRFQGRSEESN